MYDKFIDFSGTTDIIPITVGREKCASGYKFGPHVRSYYVIHFCLSGKGTLIDKFGKREISAGELFIIRPDEVSTYMWHGGAHHIGYDVHDVVETPELIAPGMMFCVDVGIYHEEWGIGFRLEDNCLVTEDGCENLSSAIPRTVYDIESVMRKR